jgi:hypothetical protein
MVYFVPFWVQVALTLTSLIGGSGENVKVGKKYDSN